MIANINNVAGKANYNAAKTTKKSQIITHVLEVIRSIKQPSKSLQDNYPSICGRRPFNENEVDMIYKDPAIAFKTC